MILDGIGDGVGALDMIVPFRVGRFMFMMALIAPRISLSSAYDGDWLAYFFKPFFEADVGVVIALCSLLQLEEDVEWGSEDVFLSDSVPSSLDKDIPISPLL